MSNYSQKPPTTPNPSTPSELAQPDLSRVNPAELAIYDQQLENDKNAAGRRRDTAVAAAEDAHSAAEAAWAEAQRRWATAERTAKNATTAAYEASAVELVAARKDLGKPGCEAPQKLRVLQEQQLLKQLQADLVEVGALAAAAAAKDTAEAAWKAAATTLDFAKKKAEAGYNVDIKNAETEYYKKISKVIA